MPPYFSGSAYTVWPNSGGVIPPKTGGRGLEPGVPGCGRGSCGIKEAYGCALCWVSVTLHLHHQVFSISGHSLLAGSPPLWPAVDLNLFMGLYHCVTSSSHS